MDDDVDLSIVVFLVTVYVDDNIIYVGRTKDIQGIAKHYVNPALKVCRGASKAKGAY
jgi:hypothetical protein